MKKTTLIIIAMLFSLTVFAQDGELWNYSMQFTTAPVLPADPTGGTGWYVGLLNSTSDLELDVKPGGALNTGTFLVVPWVTANALVEGQSVYYHIINAANTWEIYSQAAILPDIDGTVGPGDNNVTLSFSGQSWQAVPEPATALLFGIGGLGAFIVRRNKKKAQEEADA